MRFPELLPTVRIQKGNGVPPPLLPLLPFPLPFHPSVFLVSCLLLFLLHLLFLALFKILTWYFFPHSFSLLGSIIFCWLLPFFFLTSWFIQFILFIIFLIYSKNEKKYIWNVCSSSVCWILYFLAYFCILHNFVLVPNLTFPSSLNRHGLKFSICHLLLCWLSAFYL